MTVQISFLLVFISLIMKVDCFPKSEKIVGGFKIEIDQAPYQASLQIYSKNSWPNICGGVILTEKFILSAAHCCERTNNISVRVGSSEKLSGGILIGANEIIIHDKYNSKSYDYDFCLLELETSIDFDDTKKPVNLPSQHNNLSENELLLATGFGRTENGMTLSLFAVSLPVYNFTKCQEMLLQIDPEFILTETMFCAGFDNDIKKTYKGDSGGPLVTLKDNVLYGITSWGISYQNSKYPRVFGRVTQILDWINKFIKM